MNWKSFIVGAAVGILSGYAAREIFSNNSKVSPEKVLENVKKQFTQKGPITGSWIHMAVEPYEIHDIHYQVYKGGISKNIDGVNEQYEFAADASTGTLIDVRRLSAS
ncbi:PepSY domain-containing protein [Neobacillus kokaensis]|uniref:Peptidase M4 n=1 Tax=Neobacillus kokaensis TaxID=2759023 RepID=A0ABQ3N026_9BACI|nr:PepSY domain-containing protein [Neobacillus kokaensis]GHH97333.1 peptidase M4 [Neobacillus kokaensis]